MAIAIAIAGLMLMGCAGTPKKDFAPKGSMIPAPTRTELDKEKATLERVSKVTEELVGRLTAPLPIETKMRVTLGNFPQTGLFGRMLRNRLAATGRVDVVVREEDTLRLLSKVSKSFLQPENVDAVVDVNLIPLSHYYYVEAFIVDTKNHVLLSSVEMILDKLSDPYLVQGMEGSGRMGGEEFRRYRSFSFPSPLLISR